MDSVGIHVFSFSILPVIIAAGHLGLDRSSRPGRVLPQAERTAHGR